MSVSSPRIARIGAGSGAGVSEDIHPAQNHGKAMERLVKPDFAAWGQRHRCAVEGMAIDSMQRKHHPHTGAVRVFCA
jgi:hypothetical protein